MPARSRHHSGSQTPGPGRICHALRCYNKGREVIVSTTKMPPRKKRGESWTEEDLKAALRAVRKGKLSQRAIALKFIIPRRTLRDHVKTGQDVKRLGRKPVLTNEQENDLCSRIKRFAKIGVPLTPKFIRKQAYMFCELNDIKHNFNTSKKIAGADWLRQFLKRNPSISKRKPQIMNPARAQKLNKPIVQHHFESVKNLYDELDILEHPEKLYNMDEKGCRITVHNQQTVLAEKGSKRVHLIAPEHAENVTIAMCVNAIGSAIPPMIIFKGQRKRPELKKNLPAGALVKMAPKGSMTTELFVRFIQPLAKYKVPGKILLIFDGAKCHLSIEVLEEADKNDIVLYCLPSNTTHELQPLDKAVNRSYEYHWDEEVLKHLYVSTDRTLSKNTFNEIFSKVWPKCMTHNNIVNGFKATGLFPYNPDIIPEEAFAPSVLTEISAPQTQMPLRKPLSTTDDNDEDHTDVVIVQQENQQKNYNKRKKLVSYSSSSDFSDIEEQNPISEVSPSLLPEPDNNLACVSNQAFLDDNFKENDPAVPSCSGIQSLVRENSDSDATLSDIESFVPRLAFQSLRCCPENIYSYSSEDSFNDGNLSAIDKQETPRKQVICSNQNEISYSKFLISSDDDIPLASLKQKQQSQSQFQQLLPTPNYALTKSKKPRKKAMNYKGQKITRDLFNDKTKEDRKDKKHAKTMNKEENNTKIKENRNNKRKEKDEVEKSTKTLKKNKNEEEDWYCYACCEIKQLDMRQCSVCKRWYHEECVGLSKCDLEFTCPDC